MGRLNNLIRNATGALGDIAISKARQTFLPSQQQVQGVAAPDPLQQNKPNVPRSSFLDQWLALAQGLQWREQRGGGGPQNTFDQIDSICYQMPVVGLIINTRAAQVQQFGKPAKTPYDIGFRISLRDEKEKPSDASAKVCETLTKFFWHTGVPGTNDNLRDTLPVYLRKVTWDTLRFAQDATEIVPDNQGRPSQFYAIDASTIRVASNTSPVWSPDIDREIRYVQVTQGRVVTQYRHQDIIFGVRNATTSVRNAGYGVSELEIVARAIASMLYAWNYNAKFFAQGNNAKGIINIPELPQDQLEEFRSAWYAMLRGVDNAHATPVLSSEKDLQWIDLSKTQRDIEYQAYMDMLTKILCAAYAMAPDEINFSYGNVGQKQALTQTDNKQKLVDSRERGLRPLLQHFEHAFNTRVLHPLTEDFKFEFVGLDSMTRTEAQEFNGKRVTTTMTINEVRASDDLPPIEGGNIILNPTFVQAKMAGAQQAPGMTPGMDAGPEDGEQTPDALNEDAEQAEQANVDVSDLEGEDDGDDEDDEPGMSKARPHRGRIGAWRL